MRRDAGDPSAILAQLHVPQDQSSCRRDNVERPSCAAENEDEIWEADLEGQARLPSLLFPVHAYLGPWHSMSLDSQNGMQDDSRLQ